MCERGGDCDRITGILAASDDLPDHVCVETMRATCKSWINMNVVWDSHSNVTIPLGDGRIASVPHLESRNPEDYPWPVPMLGFSSVICVIRQWTGSAPEERLTPILLETAEWKSLISSVSGFMKAAYEKSDDWVLVRFAQMMLLEHSLPATIETAQYVVSTILKSEGLHAETQWPSRGLLVTSTVIIQGKHLTDNVPGDIINQVAGSALWAGSSWDRVSSTIHRHKDWIRNHCPVSLPGTSLPRTGRPPKEDWMTKHIDRRLNNEYRSDDEFRRYIAEESGKLWLAKHKTYISGEEADSVSRRAMRRLNTARNSKKS